jgi:hypothetical protein
LDWKRLEYVSLDNGRVEPGQPLLAVGKNFGIGIKQRDLRSLGSRVVNEVPRSRTDVEVTFAEQCAVKRTTTVS